MTNLLEEIPNLPRKPIGRLNWRALVENKCPKCDWGLKPAPNYGQMINCSKCDFQINPDKFREITDDLIENERIPE